jgi:hypothetical protein
MKLYTCLFGDTDNFIKNTSRLLSRPSSDVPLSDGYTLSHPGDGQDLLVRGSRHKFQAKADPNAPFARNLSAKSPITRISFSVAGRCISDIPTAFLSEKE